MKAQYLWPRAPIWSALTSIGLFVCSGCGSTPAPAPADEGQAKRTLDQALSAWQKGESVEAIKKASPPIVIKDPKWQRGDSLKKFEVDGAGKPSGAEREFKVTLWFADSEGKEVREEVVYRVGTQPILTVFRAMF
jgi:hypothetical protein